MRFDLHRCVIGAETRQRFANRAVHFGEPEFDPAVQQSGVQVDEEFCAGEIHVGNVAHEADDEARRRGVTPIVLRRGDDLRKLAEQAAEQGADVIGMAGGDGSQALVADVARQHDLPFVCVPAGTRNHFALDLGVDREDVVGALDAFLDGGERRVEPIERADPRRCVRRGDALPGDGQR